MNERNVEEVRLPDYMVQAARAVQYLDEYGLVVTVTFSPENPPSEEVGAVLQGYLRYASEAHSKAATATVIDAVRIDLLGETDENIEQEVQEMIALIEAAKSDPNRSGK